MKKLIIIFCLMSSSCFAIDLNKAIFSIEPENLSYLGYVKFHNNFPNASLEMTYGEFRMNAGDTTVKLLFDITEQWPPLMGGDSLQRGVDTTLMAKCKTIPFVYDSNSSVSFFRQTSVGTPCGSENSDWTGFHPEDYNPIQSYFLVSKNSILDTSEFVIELANADSPQGPALASLDSIVIMPNGSSFVAPIYGTSPFIMNRTVDLPDEFAGVNCILRISPRRWGPTLYGMKLGSWINWVNYSLGMEYDSTGKEWHLDSLQMEDLILRYQNRIIEFQDSMVNFTGDIGMICMFVFDSAFSEFYANRYGEKLYDEWGPYYRTTGRINYEKRKLFESESGNGGIYIKNLYPQPALRFSEVNLEIISNAQIPAEISLYSLAGFKIRTLWKGNIKEGSNLQNLKISDLPSGTYVLSLQDSNNEFLAFKKFQITN